MYLSLRTVIQSGEFAGNDIAFREWYDLVQIDGGHFGQFFMSLRAEGVAIFREKIPSPLMGEGYKRVALVYPTLYLARDVRMKFPPPSNSLPPREGRLFCVFSLSLDGEGQGEGEKSSVDCFG